MITLGSIRQMVRFLETLRKEVEGHLGELNGGLPVDVYTTDAIIPGSRCTTWFPQCGTMQNGTAWSPYWNTQ